MTLDQIVALARTIAPDFRVGQEMHSLGPTVVARATFRGKPRELVMLIDGKQSVEAALERVAHGALVGLQRLQAGGA